MSLNGVKFESGELSEESQSDTSSPNIRRSARKIVLPSLQRYNDKDFIVRIPTKSAGLGSPIPSLLSVTSNLKKEEEQLLDEEEEEEEDGNNEYCDCCFETGTLVCCEKCPRSFHFACTDPPVNPHHLPEKWYCNPCQYDKNNSLPGIHNRLFRPLLKKWRTSNPLSFFLPEDIRTYFKGVTWDPLTGAYMDAVAKKSFKLSQGQNLYFDGLSYKEDIVDFRKLCHACGDSYLKGTMAYCDYCPLAWHMDCVTPPLVIPPVPTQKWMCPNHADQYLLRKKREPVNPERKEDILVSMNNIECKEKSLLKDNRHVVPECSVKLKFLKAARESETRQRGIHVPENLKILYEESANKSIIPSHDEAGQWLDSLLAFQDSIAVQLKKKIKRCTVSTQTLSKDCVECSVQTELDVTNVQGGISMFMEKPANEGLTLFSRKLPPEEILFIPPLESTDSIDKDLEVIKSASVDVSLEESSPSYPENIHSSPTSLRIKRIKFSHF